MDDSQLLIFGHIISVWFQIFQILYNFFACHFDFFEEYYSLLPVPNAKLGRNTQYCHPEKYHRLLFHQ